jgi:hypothetical protein
MRLVLYSRQVRPVVAESIGGPDALNADAGGELPALLIAGRTLAYAARMLGLPPGLVSLLKVIALRY